MPNKKYMACSNVLPISSVLFSNKYVTNPSLKEHKHAFWLNFKK